MRSGVGQRAGAPQHRRLVQRAEQRFGGEGLGREGRLEAVKVIDEIEEKPDFIVLDPPREGIHPKALPKIVDLYRCEKMLYISCKPTSLARDLVEFAKYGYRVEKVCCVDMFPGTCHVETVVGLHRKDM